MRGFGLLEIVIAVSIISATIFSLSFVFIVASRLESDSLNKIRANFIAEEGLEAMRFLRDQSWATNLAGLSAGATYYLSFTPSTSNWSIGGSGSEIDNLFSRKVSVSKVSRDPSTQDIESTYNPSNDDPDTKKFTVLVEWIERNIFSSVSISAYLSNIFNN